MKNIGIVIVLLAVMLSWGTIAVSAETVPQGSSFEDPITPLFDGITPLETPVLVKDAPCCFVVYGVGGTVLTVVGEDAYVVMEQDPWDGCDGVRYEAVTGCVTVEIPAGNPRMPVYFAIGTSADTAVSYSYTFDYPKGTINNPILVEESGTLTVTQQADATDAVYYTYTASQDGLLSFDVTSDPSDGLMRRISFFNIVKESGAVAAFPEDIVNGNGSLEVEVGDSISFFVVAEGNQLSLPQADISVLITLTLEDGTVPDGSHPSEPSPDTGDTAVMTAIALFMATVGLFAIASGHRLGI